MGLLVFIGAISLIFPMFYQAIDFAAIKAGPKSGDFVPTQSDLKVQAIPTNETNMTNPFNMAAMHTLNPLPTGLVLDSSINKPF